MKAMFTFDATFPDGSPRRHAGMWRPTLDDANRITRNMTADEFNMFSTSYPGHWGSFEEFALHLGRFDKPLYHIEEHEREQP